MTERETTPEIPPPPPSAKPLAGPLLFTWWAMPIAWVGEAANDNAACPMLMPCLPGVPTCPACKR